MPWWRNENCGCSALFYFRSFFCVFFSVPQFVFETWRLCSRINTWADQVDLNERLLPVKAVERAQSRNEHIYCIGHGHHNGEYSTQTKKGRRQKKKKNSEQRRNSRVSVQHSSTWRLVGVNVCVLCCMAYKCIHTRCSCVFVCRIMSDTKWCSKRKWKTDRQTVGRKKTTTTK